MSQLEKKNTICPVGISDCDWVIQVQQLQQDVCQLQTQVSTDPLTGLFNYRYFEQALQNEMQRSDRTGLPTALVMVDLDLFKQVNDRWGHEGGNKALQLAANVFRQELRVVDIVCRYGGEEFVLILPQTSLPMAVKVAQRVRATLQRSAVEFADTSFNITASLGVALYQAHDQQSFETFVDSADQYLYQAKQQGRNQVCHADFAAVKPVTSVSQEERAALFARARPEDD